MNDLLSEKVKKENIVEESKKVEGVMEVIPTTTLDQVVKMQEKKTGDLSSIDSDSINSTTASTPAATIPSNNKPPKKLIKKPVKALSTTVTGRYLQGEYPRRVVHVPMASAEYAERLRACHEYNQMVNLTRNNRIKRQRVIAMHGYEAVIDRTTRMQNAINQYQLDATEDAVTLPANDKTKNISGNCNVASNRHREAVAVGNWVKIIKSSELWTCGGNHLVGKMGKVLIVPANVEDNLCGVMFKDSQAVQYLPLSAVFNFDIPALPAETNHSINPSSDWYESREIQGLLRAQYNEVQTIQRKYSVDNAMSDGDPILKAAIFQSMSTLRAKHLLQIQQLQQQMALKTDK